MIDHGKYLVFFHSRPLPRLLIFNNNNSYMALYPVMIYELTVLCSISININMIIKNKNNNKKI